jgi:small subunit ribosomal protein S20
LRVDHTIGTPVISLEGLTMANTSSAQKAARKMVRRTEINKSRRTRIKTDVRKVEEAIAAGDHQAALAALRAAEPELAKAAQKGVIHARTASRKTSRLSARIKAMGA